jgi:DNA recombination protein RmuC
MMENLYPFLTGALCAVVAVLLAALLRRRAAKPETDIDASVKTGFDQVVSELHRAETEIKSEINSRIEALRMAVDNRLDSLSDSTAKKLGESSDRLNAASDETRKTLDARLEKLTEALDGKLDKTRIELSAAAAETRKTLDARLEGIIAKNDEKLEQMRLTVDEKLQSTLEKRLSESFKLVGDNLEKVIQSMGEMRAVAADVGDLKRVLTNVKNRGTWGEYQLSLILETLLQPDQYEANVKPRPRSDNIVEFAIKLPGRDADGKPVWLPIDSKFPKEDYERLTDAANRADADGVEAASRALSANIENSAREIRDKYLAPPHTTDFGIMFLPTEGLYAETLRRPGLVDKIQRECRVLIAGPTTLAALLNSLQMGFRTLAIEKRSSEVWKMLGAIKTQFGKFGDTLENVQKKLDAAGREIGEASQRHRVITGRLAKVEELPAAEAAQILPETVSPE